MELEEPTGTFRPLQDKRMPVPELPPVRLLAIDDIRLDTLAARESDLHAFYVGLLKFERDTKDPTCIAFKAERFRVCFDIVELPPTRDDYRAVQVEIPHFADFIEALHERQIDFEWQKGVSPGIELAFLQDPAGYWVSVGPIRKVM
ncbi:MAG: hypothetical protein ACTHLN_15335 [Tepidisphaeraceae bacterium]